jgi:hypothetical protein
VYNWSQEERRYINDGDQKESLMPKSPRQISLATCLLTHLPLHSHAACLLGKARENDRVNREWMEINGRRMGICDVGKWKVEMDRKLELTPQRLHLHQLEQETPAQQGQSLQLAIFMFIYVSCVCLLGVCRDLC